MSEEEKIKFGGNLAKSLSKYSSPVDEEVVVAGGVRDKVSSFFFEGVSSYFL